MTAARTHLSYFFPHLVLEGLDGKGEELFETVAPTGASKESKPKEKPKVKKSTNKSAKKSVKSAKKS